MKPGMIANDPGRSSRLLALVVGPGTEQCEICSSAPLDLHLEPAPVVHILPRVEANGHYHGLRDGRAEEVPPDDACLRLEGEDLRIVHRGLHRTRGEGFDVGSRAFCVEGGGHGEQLGGMRDLPVSVGVRRVGEREGQDSGGLDMERLEVELFGQDVELGMFDLGLQLDPLHLLVAEQHDKLPEQHLVVHQPPCPMPAGRCEADPDDEVVLGRQDEELGLGGGGGGIVVACPRHGMDGGSADGGVDGEGGAGLESEGLVAAASVGQDELLDVGGVGPPVVGGATDPLEVLVAVCLQPCVGHLAAQRHDELFHVCQLHPRRPLLQVRHTRRLPVPQLLQPWLCSLLLQLRQAVFHVLGQEGDGPHQEVVVMLRLLPLARDVDGLGRVSGDRQAARSKREGRASRLGGLNRQQLVADLPVLAHRRAQLDQVLFVGGRRLQQLPVDEDGPGRSVADAQRPRLALPVDQDVAKVDGRNFPQQVEPQGPPFHPHRRPDQLPQHRDVHDREADDFDNQPVPEDAADVGEEVDPHLLLPPGLDPPSVGRARDSNPLASLQHPERLLRGVALVQEFLPVQGSEPLHPLVVVGEDQPACQLPRARSPAGGDGGVVPWEAPQRG
mmetsp:Transcript_24275/g.54605  ORF Transcript_24275/g.54605 Transcript_24275/m.54605 type:complete len:614 (+) Transcript_24275:1391-3232(+)